MGLGGDEVIRRLAWWVTEQCLPDGDEIEQEVVAYGLECRISDLVQVAMLVFLGLTLRRALEMLWFSVCFTVLKRQVGGFHLGSHFSCIGVFSLLAVAASKLAVSIPSVAVLPGTLITLALVLWRAPIAHSNHPKSKAAHKKSRRASIRIAAIAVVLLPLITQRFPAWAVAGAIGELLAALSLVIPVKTERSCESKVLIQAQA